ncbi:MAG: DUF2156 domain-containing protein [Clostridia bacterium]|nr:DUF2156 domain-containing protein [Clostridia bacterium]
MVFEKLTSEHIPLLRTRFAQQGWRICDCSAGAVVMWADFLGTEIGEAAGRLVLRGNMPGGPRCFSFPIGSGDAGAALDEIERYAAEAGADLLFDGVPEEGLAVLRARYGERLTASTDPDEWDYLYEADALKTFPGKKLSGPRNHLNKFRRLYPDAHLVEVDDGNRDRVRDFCRAFAAERQGDVNLARQEGRASVRLIDLIDRIGPAAFLEAGGELVAVCLGEVVDDTLFVHVEKALGEYPGVYQAMVSAFAEKYAVGGVKYINREEDDGVPGLRQSKESYRPVAMLKKYLVRIG